MHLKNFFDKNNLISKQLLTNLEDEIFLKGGSVVTPKILTLFYLLKCCQEIKHFQLSSFNFCDFGFIPLVGKTFKGIVGLDFSL